MASKRRMSDRFKKLREIRLARNKHDDEASIPPPPAFAMIVSSFITSKREINRRGSPL